MSYGRAFQYFGATTEKADYNVHVPLVGEFLRLIDLPIFHSSLPDNKY